MVRRLPGEVLNVMITAAAAENKKVKTVIWMRIVQKREVVFNMVMSTRVGRGRVFTSKKRNFVQSR